MYIVHYSFSDNTTLLHCTLAKPEERLRIGTALRAVYCTIFCTLGKGATKSALFLQSLQTAFDPLVYQMMTMMVLTIVQALHLHRMALVKGDVAVLGSALKPTHTGWTREGVRKQSNFQVLA